LQTKCKFTRIKNRNSMALQNTNPTTTSAWGNIQQHFQELENVSMTKMFQEDKPKAKKSTRPAPTIETEVKPKRKRRAK